MTITCNECDYNQNPDHSSFCEACGSELQAKLTDLEKLRHELLENQRTLLELIYRSDSYLCLSEPDQPNWLTEEHPNNNTANIKELKVMAITCEDCGYDQNPIGSEFCDACGSDKLKATETAPESIEEPMVQPSDSVNDRASSPVANMYVSDAVEPSLTPTTATTAQLISKTAGSPIPEFTLEESSIVGIFDPDRGPVEIDLENFPGGDTVSRAHGEIYLEGGEWKVKDIGSTNGIYIKPSQQSRFGARITTPQTLNPGDEIAFGKVRFLFQTP